MLKIKMRNAGRRVGCLKNEEQMTVLLLQVVALKKGNLIFIVHAMGAVLMLLFRTTSTSVYRGRSEKLQQVTPGQRARHIKTE
ncbi:MAG: hypothetical protein CMK83_05275 [Pseudomonadales bacterium]|jgi:mannose-6-phosphate isomerase class I|nr:hypothetical protein [Pseudomonadales bacterium]TNC90809.1 MAG: hypothetical protein CSH49_01350 [Alcanivorax sp.]HAG96612.1 hypothetical protein [Gammaproteobacteria bacterium]MAQ23610.1 hypothetical protein [Pseudomonadales bacterium]HAU12911.1 hypothetical protein [Gammaproteobacteria bacterium]|tara:strand:- start:223 stop:471 length:249 start_codon:yes stop_codon:yes gene_type:complete